MRERMGIRENLVRIAVGIENVQDIKDDLDQALRTVQALSTAEDAVSQAL
jgi:cystathionine beta-lyase/cystathionine gamma-synthase